MPQTSISATHLENSRLVFRLRKAPSQPITTPNRLLCPLQSPQVCRKRRSASKIKIPALFILLHSHQCMHLCKVARCGMCARARARVLGVPFTCPPFCVSLIVSFESHRLKTLCHTFRKVSDPSTAMAHFATKQTPNTNDTFCRRKARHGTHRHIPRHSHRPRSFES